MERIRIVLVDDHPLIRAGFRAFCSLQNDLVVVGEAGDGKSALHLVHDLHPDVVALDARLPVVDGVAVAQEIRLVAPETRILVFTGYTDDVLLARTFLKLGVEGYLAKTAGFRELAATLRRIQRGETYVDPTIACDLVADAPTQVEDLTRRELDVLEQVADGKRDRDIARSLGISENTVRFHIMNLFAKFKAVNRTEVVQRARDHGWYPGRALSERAATPSEVIGEKLPLSRGSCATDPLYPLLQRAVVRPRPVGRAHRRRPRVRTP